MVNTNRKLKNAWESCDTLFRCSRIHTVDPGPNKTQAMKEAIDTSPYVGLIKVILDGDGCKQDVPRPPTIPPSPCGGGGRAGTPGIAGGAGIAGVPGGAGTSGMAGGAGIAGVPGGAGTSGTGG